MEGRGGGWEWEFPWTRGEGDFFVSLAGIPVFSENGTDSLPGQDVLTRYHGVGFVG